MVYGIASSLFHVDNFFVMAGDVVTGAELVLVQ